MLRSLTSTVLVAASALVALAGCGTTTDVGVVGDPGTSPSTSAIAHPTGHDDVVLRLDVAGGFVAVEWAFAEPAQLVVTGDGTVYVPAEPRQGEDRLLRPIAVGQLGEQRLQGLLRSAGDLGLLHTPPDYQEQGGIHVSDAPTTTVRIDAAGGSFRHAAYALGMTARNETGPRGRLEHFVAQLRALTRGLATRPYPPTAVRIMAAPATPGLVGGGSAKATPWPAEAGIALADVHRCAVVTAPAAVDALAAATPFTRFVDRGVAYQVSATVVLPGDRSC
jgi:hypothetical protein